MIGARRPAVGDMTAFLSHGVRQLIHGIEADRMKSTHLLESLNQVVACKLTDKSLAATVNAIAADYAHRAESGASVGQIVSSVNALPRPALGYKSPMEVAGELLGSNKA